MGAYMIFVAFGNLGFELVKGFEVRKRGKWVVTYKNERETLNYDKWEMILIYHLAIYYYRSGCSRLSWHRGRKVEKSSRIAKGRQVITLTLL